MEDNKAKMGRPTKKGNKPNIDTMFLYVNGEAKTFHSLEYMEEKITEESQRIWEEARKKAETDLYSFLTEIDSKTITLSDLKKILFGEEKEK